VESIIERADNETSQNRSQPEVIRLKDTDCVRFLQWALPRLGMRWQGFRRVRRQVCRRLQRRLSELQLDTLAQYRSLLAGGGAEAEWAGLDRLCRISISRFYRDKGVFQRLEHELLPGLQTQVLAQGRHLLRIWSIGCASGEEPYTLALMCAFTQAVSRCQVEIVATDADPHLLTRARRACYPASSLRELPNAWRIAFEIRNDEFCLQSKYREVVSLAEQDIRLRSADGLFELILCRNLVFTYFKPALQIEIARRLADALVPGGMLLLGAHETLPEPLSTLEAESAWLYRRVLEQGTNHT
jgi:chemotaxis protein methyltransferase CheR